jgi:hypothetical protein
MADLGFCANWAHIRCSVEFQACPAGTSEAGAARIRKLIAYNSSGDTSREVENAFGIPGNGVRHHDGL